MDVDMESSDSLVTAVPSITKPPQTRRLRAKKACRNCWQRKVRCDASLHGSPCTNCRLDEVECVERQGKRSTKYHFSCRTTSPTEIRRIEKTVLDQPKAKSPESVLSNTNETNGSSPASPNDFVADKVLPSPSTSQTPEQLPRYISCDLRNVSIEDFGYLSAKECFVLPPKTVIEELLRCYFDFVHPNLPVIDEEDFMASYRSALSNNLEFVQPSNRKISLLLFQAVLFAASSYVSLKTLQRTCYHTRSAARRHLFWKVRALYSLDVEQDQMTVLQSLLLMTYWRDNSEDHKDAWHWSGLATSLASLIDLPGNLGTNLNERQKSLWKRCWWSCVVRDRLVSLAHKQAPRIRIEESNVPILTLGDFNVGLRSNLTSLSAEEELGKRTALSMYTMQLVRLTLCIGGSNGFSMVDSRARSLIPTETWARTSMYNKNDHFTTKYPDLDSWYSNLPEVLQYSPTASNDSAILPCILLHRNVLHMYYHKVVLHICSPKLLITSSVEEQKHATKLIHQSLNISTKLFDELIDSDLIQYIPRECLGSPLQSEDNLFSTGLAIASQTDYLRSTELCSLGLGEAEADCSGNSLKTIVPAAIELQSHTTSVKSSALVETTRGRISSDHVVCNTLTGSSDISQAPKDAEDSALSFGLYCSSTDSSTLNGSDSVDTPLSTLMNFEVLFSTGSIELK